MSTESIPSAAEMGPGALTSSKFVPPPALSLMQPPQDALQQQFGGTAQQSGGFSGLMHAFRRVWLLALTISLVCGGIAAALQWIFWKPEYVATAFLRVASSQPVVMFNTKDNAAQTNYEVYKRTQKELIRNRYVLNSALRNPKVAPLAGDQAAVESGGLVAGSNQRFVSRAMRKFSRYRCAAISPTRRPLV